MSALGHGPRALLVLALMAGLAPIQNSSSASCQSLSLDPVTFAREVRETMRREYAEPGRFTYLENRRDVDISRLGKVSVGPLRTFEVYPRSPIEDYKRLIAIDGKPLDPTELARRDAEHQRNLHRQAAREKAETPLRRAARRRKVADEIREREAILDDAAAVFELEIACREVLDGQPVIVVSLKPRPHAPVTTREGGWMKKFAGRMWVAEAGRHIARVRLQAIDEVSIGWGVVAQVEAGSGFDYVRKRIGDAWAPLELTIEGSGRTLLFRRFQVKTVTTYSNHQPYTVSPRS